MKIIIDTDTATDNVTSIVASTEDASFPATNLQNDFTTDLWKAASGVTTASLTVAVSKGSAVELLNTNATTATVTVGTGSTFTFCDGFTPEDAFDLETSTSTSTVYNLPGTGGRLWADYTAYTTPHIVKIDLAAASTVYAGILRAGEVETFRDPAPDFTEASKDFSIEAELNNGANYFRKRNIVRTFSGVKIIETRANAYTLKHKIFDAVGPEPLAVRLSSDSTDDEFILFAKRTAPPNLKYITPTHTEINLTLQEVV